MIIDTHSHLDDKQFDADRDAVVARMQEAGVAAITVGTDLEMSRKAIEIADKYNWWATVGQHPTDTQEHFDISTYRNLAQGARVVAIGECGLDYFHDKNEEGRARQKKLFEQQINLAREVSKPLMIHCRDAYQDLLSMLPNDVKAHIHFFSGDWGVAKKFLDKGYTLSFPGIITFPPKADQPRAGNMYEVVKNVSSDMFTIETDSPYVAPVPHRGKRNEPTYVLEVAKKVAELRGVSLEAVIEATTATAKRVFAL